jgi:hypothetical protein
MVFGTVAGGRQRAPTARRPLSRRLETLAIQRVMEHAEKPDNVALFQLILAVYREY